MYFFFFFLAGNNKARAHEAVKKIQEETLNDKGMGHGRVGPFLGLNRVPGAAEPHVAAGTGWWERPRREGRTSVCLLCLSFGFFCVTTFYKYEGTLQEMIV